MRAFLPVVPGGYVEGHHGHCNEMDDLCFYRMDDYQCPELGRGVRRRVSTMSAGKRGVLAWGRLDEQREWITRC